MSRERHRSRSNAKPTGTPEPKRKESKSVERTKEVLNDSNKAHHRSKSKSKDTDSSKHRKTDEKKSKSSSESKKSKSEKSSVKEKHTEKETKRKEEKKRIPSPEPILQLAETYEDDFEEYEDDFESDDEDEENVIRPPVANEQRPTTTVSSSSASSEKANEPVQRLPSEPSTPPKKEAEKNVSPIPPLTEETPMLRRLATRQGGRAPDPVVPQTTTPNAKATRIASAERRIDFTSASAQPTIAPDTFSEMDERYRKLRELVVLEPVFHLIVDVPPIKDYDFYMELFGQSGNSQSSMQTGSDDVSEETQTEEPLNEIKWTQHPPHDDYGWGSESASYETTESKEDEEMAMFRENHLQNPRLKQFVEAAGQVIIDLITSRQKTSSDLLLQNKSVFSFSLGYNSFELGPISQVNRVTTISLNSKEPDIHLAGFFIKESPAEDIVNRTLLVEFYLDHRPPKRLFLSEGDVTSTCYTADGTALVAGVVDGAVEAFDLLEPSNAFPSSLPWMDSPTDIALRLPAYDSSFLSSTLADGKAHPIVEVQVMQNENDFSSQIASLDQSGSVSVWVVLRESQGRPGVRPQAQLSLRLLALIRPDPVIIRFSSQPTPLIANCMVIRPRQQLFLVGTDAGFLCSLSKAKTASSRGPRLIDSKMDVYGEVLCVKVSPFESSVFLVGFSSGSIAVYRFSQLRPTIVLTPPSSSRKPVTSIEWSPISPSIFYSLHGHRRLLVWDLSMGLSPLAVNDLSQQIQQSKVTNTKIWLEKSESKSSKGIAYLVLGLSTGEVQVHALETIRAKNEGTLLTLLKMLDV
uniref:WD_REPEATS_REGION domain-containing protein n=1 Tax=Haemonchus contortus TaxID=6289 RepID=A0A7I4Y9J9_HAECO